jgi:hypothetical protein
MMAVSAIAQVQRTTVTWLDDVKPSGWNKGGAPIPEAPKASQPVEAKCREQARPAQSDDDKRVRDRGWDLIGAYEGGWEVVIIHATAGYDGMCRPQQYQEFVFVKGAFAGTLSPQPMDSRTDGSLTRVSLEGPARLIAEYQRYAAKDPLCCPSRTTTVVFKIPVGSPVVQPVSSSTTAR